MSDLKRKASPPPPNAGSLIKRARGPAGPSTEIAISSGDDKQKALIRNVPRTSGLDAPIVSLSGAHGGEIMSCRFDPSGQFLAACSADRSVSLWNTYPPNVNYGYLPALHKAHILDLRWSLAAPLIYTASADKTLLFTDITTGQTVRRIRGHTGVINALDRIVAPGAGVELLATASDDKTVRVWEGGDEGTKHAVATFNIGCPVTSVAWGHDANSIYVGALDNQIHVYDLRNAAEVYALSGHTDTPSSLVVSPNGQFLLSPSFSSTTLIYDIRPFSPAPDRVHRALLGAPAGYEQTLTRAAWSRDDGGQRVAVGGSDRTVSIWEVESGRVLYKLPGHKGTVTCVDFHPKEPIILTGSKDSTMLLGELDPGVRV